MKRAIIMVIVFAITLSMSVITTSAGTSNQQAASNGIIEIEPFWVNTNSIVLGITYSGTTASCSGRIRGNSNVNSITATFTLRRVNSNGTLTTVRTWSGLSSNTSSLNFSGTHSSVSSGQTYRLDVTATLTTTSGVRETVSQSFTRAY